MTEVEERLPQNMIELNNMGKPCFLVIGRDAKAVDSRAFSAASARFKFSVNRYPTLECGSGWLS